MRLTNVLLSPVAAVVATIGVAALVGCDQSVQPVATNSTNNPQAPVSLLFEYDGCKVYRFVDDYRYRYFAHCKDGTTTTSTEQPEGKYTRGEEIPTVSTSEIGSEKVTPHGCTK